MKIFVVVAEFALSEIVNQRIHFKLERITIAKWKVQTF